MLGLERQITGNSRVLTGMVVVAVLVGSFLLGMNASTLMLAGLVALLGLALLLLWPALGLPVLIAAALLAKVDIPTGTDVVLNPVILLVPAMFAILLLSVLTRRTDHLALPRPLLPMGLLLVAGLVSLIVGNATWDPFVPRSGNLILVQLAQLAIYLFSFLAFWLTANLGRDQRWLKRMTLAFLVIGGVLAIGAAVPVLWSALDDIVTIASTRAPFWLLLTGIAGGQLVFNRQLSRNQRILLGSIMFGVIFYPFFIGRESASNWVGVGTTAAVLGWLRFKRFRWVALGAILLLLLAGLLFPTVWNFAGGDDEWVGSGQSRLVLIERVLSVSMRNPVTGIGPVAYRAYAGTTPLAFQRAFWVQPSINSHNNYVDIFSQFGLVGVALFTWLVVELAALGIPLLSKYREGFAAGYVRGVLAACVGALVVMMLADWIIPFVYNIGFPGLQASLLFWLFLGGLSALAVQGSESSTS